MDSNQKEPSSSDLTALTEMLEYLTNEVNEGYNTLVEEMQKLPLEKKNGVH